jgi:adenine-specific DNA-methyltransferase
MRRPQIDAYKDWKRMPELLFKGKEFVYNHHLTVPYRPLEMHASKSIGKPSLNGNLIIHGDNLHALKALLPLYAGKVDCIFIDPPYNTGNEGWNYNDNVNSPMMKEWLSSNPVNAEDMLRHDKWCAMMYPRLKLLHELLSDEGSFWMTLDDNEIHHARDVLDEIFGEGNFIAVCIWHKVDSPKNTAEHFSVDHDYVIVYAKNATVWRLNLLPRSEAMVARYKNPDNDPRGVWLLSDLAARNFYGQGSYPITTPTGRKISGPPAGSYWRVSREKFDELAKDNRIWWGDSGGNRPGIKRFLSEVKQGVVPQTIWSWADVGSTRNSKQALSRIMSAQQGEELFITPKPVGLVERVLAIASHENSLVLDSFAGSGTTAHAVLEANRGDGGDRKFILVESEDYAEKLTAERVRRVIKGYKFEGTEREELLRDSVTYGALKNPAELIGRVEAIENLEAHRFDAVKKEVKDGELIVTGEKNVAKRTEGLGGEFTYCTLGEPIDMERLLTGKSLPEYESLGAWLFHTATGESLPTNKIRKTSWYLGESSAYHVWLVYKPELEFLKSGKAALTLELAEEISGDAAHKKSGKKHLIFAPAKYVPNKTLLPMGVEYAPLPFALYRLEKD